MTVNSQPVKKGREMFMIYYVIIDILCQTRTFKPPFLQCFVPGYNTINWYLNCSDDKEH